MDYASLFYLSLLFFSGTVGGAIPLAWDRIAYLPISLCTAFTYYPLIFFLLNLLSLFFEYFFFCLITYIHLCNEQYELKCHGKRIQTFTGAVEVVATVMSGYI